MNKLKSIRWFALLFFIMTGCSTGKGNTLDPDQEIVKGEVVTAYVTTATRSSEFVPKEISFSDRVDNMSPFTPAREIDEHQGRRPGVRPHLGRERRNNFV